MGKLNAFNPQRMTSGLSGSPTLVIYRRLSKSNFFSYVEAFFHEKPERGRRSIPDRYFGTDQ